MRTTPVFPIDVAMTPAVKSAWDANCSQHIPRRVDAVRVAAVLAERDRRIAALEAEVARLRGNTPVTPP